MSEKSKRKGSTKKSDEDLVLTPGGWRPKSKVYKIEPGQHIDGRDGHLKIVDTATGKIINDLDEIPETAASETKVHDSGIYRPEKQKQTKRSKKEEMG